MRTFGTIVFGLLFIVAFAGFFAAHSVAGYPLSTGDVVDSARAADLHGVMLGAVDVGIQEAAETSGDAAFARAIGAGLKDVLADAIPEAWFYEMLEKAHAGFVAFLEGGTDAVQIELADVKKRVRAFMMQIADEVGSTGDIDPDTLKGRVDDMLKVVPETVNLSAIIARAGGDPAKLNASKELDTVRDGLGKFKLVRYAGLGAVVVLLGLIMLIAMKTRKRLLVSTGIVLALAGGLYLAGTSVLSSTLADVIKDETAVRSGASRADAYATEAATKVTTTIVDKAVTRSNGLVAGITVLGLVMFVGGIVLRPKAPAQA